MVTFKGTFWRWKKCINCVVVVDYNYLILTLLSCWKTINRNRMVVCLTNRWIPWMCRFPLEVYKPLYHHRMQMLRLLMGFITCVTGTQGIVIAFPFIFGFVILRPILRPILEDGTLWMHRCQNSANCYHRCFPRKRHLSLKCLLWLITCNFGKNCITGLGWTEGL